MLTRVAASALGLLVGLACVGTQALTAVDTLITNQSTAGYEWEGGAHNVSSNLVRNRVGPRYGLEIVPDGTVAAPALRSEVGAGTTAYYAYTLINTGNTSDSYRIRLPFLSAPSDFEPVFRRIFLDTNGNGTLEPGEGRYAIDHVGPVPPDGLVHLIVAIDIPLDAGLGQTTFFDLQGESMGDSTATDTGNVNQTVVTDDASLSLEKSASPPEVYAGDSVSYTLSALSIGGAPARGEKVSIDGVDRRGVIVSDAVPEHASAGTTYVAGSLTVSTDQGVRVLSLDGGATWLSLAGLGDEAGIADQVTDVGLVLLGDGDLMPPGQRLVLDYRVRVNPRRGPEPIRNTATLRYRTQSDDPRQDQATNTVFVRIRVRADEVLIGPYRHADAEGVTDLTGDGVVDNNDDFFEDQGVPVTDPNPYGTQVAGNAVTFLNTVRNASPYRDTLNITIDPLTNLPAGWTVQILRVSAITPLYENDGVTVRRHPATGEVLYSANEAISLPDTNGDGVPDTGPLDPDQETTVGIRVWIPEDALSSDNGGAGFRTVVRAASSIDPGIRNLTTNILSRILALGQFWDPFVKSQDAPGLLTVGATIPYTNTFGNNGPGPVYNTIIRDELSDDLTNVRDITTGTITDLYDPGVTIDVTGWYDAATHAVIWHIFEIPKDFTGQVHFRADVAPGTPDGREIPNIFSITSDQTETVRTSNLVVNVSGGEAILLLTKEANLTRATVGDPVLYTIEVENDAIYNLDSLVLHDTLPAGLVYQQGSATLDGVAFEPLISPDRMELRWNLGTLAPGQTHTITYVCVVGVNSRPGTLTNTVTGTGTTPKGAIVPIQRTAEVIVEEDGVFANRSVIFGKVFVDQNDNRVQDAGEPGVGNVRLYLEDGTFVLTDREGKYHVSGVHPGMHVIRLDHTTLPRDEGWEVAAVDSQNALNPLSRYVELRYGTPHKANFRLVRPQADQDRDAAAAPEDAGVDAPPAPAVLEAVDLVADGGAARVVIQVSTPVPYRFEHDEVSGLVHVELEGVREGIPDQRTEFEDANVQELRVYRDAGTGMAKVQVRLRKHTTGYPTAVTEADGNRITVLVGDPEATPDPVPGTGVENQTGESPDSTVPRILSPADGEAFIARGQINVQTSCHLAAQFELFVNDTPVPVEQIGHKRFRVRERLAEYEYVAVPLEPGENRIRFEVRMPGQSEPRNATVTVLRSADPVALDVDIQPGYLMADGQTEPVMRIVLLDANGVATAEGGVVHVEVDQGDILSPDLRPMERRHQVQVRDGRATVRFSAAAHPEVRKVSIEAGPLHREVELKFRPHLRDWIVNGVVSGAAERTESENAGNTDWATDLDKRVALFAKGGLPYEMTLTTAYDSDKPDEEDEIFREEDPLKYYPVYGDDSEQDYEAESRDRLFLRLERDTSYAMYGDFETDLDQNGLAAYDRRLTGAAAHVETTFVDVDAFFSRSDQALVRTELRGRGISGYYSLPDAHIVRNSEEITIEVRDRNHPDRVLDTASLRRFSDYSIDYESGRLLFKRPVPSQDQDHNPVFIVARYEVDGRKNREYNTYGGRVALHNAERTLELGGTYIVDENAPEDHVIQGVDGTWEIREGLRLHGEYATTSATDGTTDDAFRLELQSDLERAAFRLYGLAIGDEFDNDSMRGDTAGRTRVGLEGVFQVTDTLRFEDEIYLEKDQVQEERRAVVIHDVIHDRGDWSVLVGGGYVHEEVEKPGEEETRRAALARLGGGVRLTPKLGVEALHQQAMGGETFEESTRSELELTYDYSPETTFVVGAERRRMRDGGFDVNVSAGVESRITSYLTGFQRYELDGSAGGQSVRSGSGLETDFAVSPELSLGASFEINHTLDSDTDGREQDFWAAATGFEYRPQGDKYTAIGRFEVRDEDRETSYLTELGGTLKLGTDHTVFGRNILNYTADKQGDAGNGDGWIVEILTGWAYRPVAADRFNLISDIEVVYEDNTEVTNYERLNRVMLSTEAHYQPMDRLMLAGKYACKYVTTGYSDDVYSDVKAGSLRLDLNDRFFATAGVRWLSQYTEAQQVLGYGLGLGVNVSRDLRFQAGYNFEGVEDRDFERGESWDKGVYVQLHWKFDESIFGVLRRLEGRGKEDDDGE